MGTVLSNINRFVKICNDLTFSDLEWTWIVDKILILLAYFMFYVIFANCNEKLFQMQEVAQKMWHKMLCVIWVNY
jgi:hypothetical protein